MKILTLDDMKVRQDEFRRWFIGHEHEMAWTAEGAILHLEEQVWDLVMLDHDLAEEHYLTLSEGLREGPLPGEPAYTPGTGMDVVNHIVSMSSDRRPKRVIVHSWNPVRSYEMVARLEEAGVPTWKIPFKPGLPINLK